MQLLEHLNKMLEYDPKSPMIFNSGHFFILFTFFLIAYTLIYKRKFVVSLFVIAFSFFFYYKSSGFYLLILAFTSISDYVFALLIHKEEKLQRKKLWLFLSVGSSLGILGFFKYTNFFLRNFIEMLRIFGNFPLVESYLKSQPAVFQFTFQELIQSNFQPLDIFLPIGISFYTFQSISYVLDVYWKKIEPTRNFLDYAFFLSFFPQLVAGPIVKANHFLPQLKKPINLNKTEIYSGFFLLIIGLIKKAVIADYISQYNDIVFASPENYSGFENLMAVYGYTLQIYCDFSGYSDMAIGLGKIMGFDLGVNFRFPYQAFNITDFWRRWHISLSSWLKEYLYIPLGGNRKGKTRMYINLFITMLLGGLWHGASWKFVFWGALHGIALALHKASKPLLDKTFPDKWFTKAVSWFVTFHFVMFLWIFFRAENFGLALEIVNKIISDVDLRFFIPFVQARSTWIALLSIGFLTHAISYEMNNKLIEKFVVSPYFVKILIFMLAVQLVIQFQSEDVQPFIYFQF
ncbi:MAG: membrane-bound O-acyltransferase family protein [Bacteroidia bacterium]|nr:MAG: membrane-bound O-acyltransferase family protein [Bacteroidia bacterium]